MTALKLLAVGLGFSALAAAVFMRNGSNPIEQRTRSGCDGGLGSMSRRLVYGSGHKDRLVGERYPKGGGLIDPGP
jgi:hypothetical protein